MKKICVISSTRADYGLFYPLLKQIKNDSSFMLWLVVTGTHLLPCFGLTYREIEHDGFTIYRKVRIPASDDSEKGITESLSAGLVKFSRLWEHLRPDLVLILGDRFEIFSAAISAHIARIPIAHLYGGESTQGAIDDAFRHSITKMSLLHFVSNKEHKKRVIQLGEDPRRVFNVGATGLDNIKNLKFISRSKLEKELGFRFNKNNLLITYHPVTLEDNTSEKQFSNLLKALDEQKNTRLIFTKANADTHNRIINKMIDSYTKDNPHKATAFDSLGRLRYLSVMRLVDAVVGNSSSGIIEAPSFKIGTINIGDRQKGRTKAASVIDCEPTIKDIRAAFNKLHSKNFQKAIRGTVNPYGDGNAAKRIKRVLRSYNATSDMLKKRFYDV